MTVKAAIWGKGKIWVRRRLTILLFLLILLSEFTKAAPAMTRSDE